MKLIIQVPCYNEEETLPCVIRDLPRAVDGVDFIEYLVIDDGSTDRTVATARRYGVHHVISLGANQGCGAAFIAGIRACLKLGADIIVNTDGDNQYAGRCVANLIQPILDYRADIVIGSRPIEEISAFSPLKKKLQRIGSMIVRHLSNTNVPDVTSGFRAFSADAAMKLDVLSFYNHTLETLIQAGHLPLRICHVPVEVNLPTRPSRLMTSTTQYVWRSIFIILRAYIRHRPIRHRPSF